MNKKKMNDEIKNLTIQCKNEELAKFLHDCEKNEKNKGSKIKWIPSEEFHNVKKLTKGGFGIIHTAEWQYNQFHCREVVALKSIHDSQNAIPIILKEVKNKIRE